MTGFATDEGFDSEESSERGELNTIVTHESLSDEFEMVDNI